MLRFVEVTPENHDIAIKIQNTIFPNENGRDEIVAGAYQIRTDRMDEIYYWIAYEGETPVGICGITEYLDYPEDCFLGWYGVLENHRRSGYGRKMFEHCKQKAKEKGYKTLRLYTDEVDNSVAVLAYKQFGMTGEYYEHPTDKTVFVGKQIVFSIPLDGKELVKWNNRMLYLAEEDEIESKYRKKK